MSYTSVKPGGGWIDGSSTITSAQITGIDTGLQNAIDGNGGGNYNATSTIGIAGQGITLNSGATLKCSARTKTIYFDPSASQAEYVATATQGWLMRANDSAACWYGGGYSKFLQCPLSGIQYGTITEVGAYVSGSTTPADPTVLLKSRNVSTGAQSTLATLTGSASSSSHLIRATGLSIALSPSTLSYYLSVQDVGSAANGCSLWSWYVVVSYAVIDY